LYKIQYPYMMSHSFQTNHIFCLTSLKFSSIEIVAQQDYCFPTYCAVNIVSNSVLFSLYANIYLRINLGIFLGYMLKFPPEQAYPGCGST